MEFHKQEIEWAERYKDLGPFNPKALQQVQNLATDMINRHENLVRVRKQERCLSL